MRLIRAYAVCSMVIGAGEVLDGWVLGRPGLGLVRIGFSLVEFAWVGVSIWALIACVKSGLPRWGPVTFLAYNVAGWVLGVVLMLRSSDPKAVTSPPWYDFVMMGFGAWFVFVNLRLWREVTMAAASGASAGIPSP